MPPSRVRSESASLALARVAPLMTRWVERSLAGQSPPLTLAQYLALEQLDRGRVSAAELAQGASISRSAVSRAVASLEREGRSGARSPRATGGSGRWCSAPRARRS